jgi:hypothetical protein
LWDDWTAASTSSAALSGQDAKEVAVPGSEQERRAYISLKVAAEHLVHHGRNAPITSNRFPLLAGTHFPSTNESRLRMLGSDSYISVSATRAQFSKFLGPES